MRIGIDTRPLAIGYGGIARMLRRICRELGRIDSENSYYLYGRGDFFLPFENSYWQRQLHPRVPYLLSDMWLRAKDRSKNASQKALDVFLATGHWFPLGLPPAVARVIMAYDLVWHFYPETMVGGHRVAMALLADSSLHSAERVIAISQSARRDIVNRLGIPPDKIEVIYPGVDALFAPQDREISRRRIAKTYGVSENYLCTVGTVEPRKNLIALIEAMKILGDRGNFPYQLLIAGKSGWKNSAIYSSAERNGLDRARS